MRGRLSSLKPEKGFGFIIDEAGFSRFFHANHIDPSAPRFRDLQEGWVVEFEPYEEPGEGKGNGLRARRVTVIPS